MFYLGHFWEMEYDRTCRKALGYFVSHQKVFSVIGNYKKLPGFQDKQYIYDSEKHNDYPDDFAGFAHWRRELELDNVDSRGYVTYPYTLPKETRTFIDYIPDFVMDDDALKDFQEDPIVTAVKQKKIVPYPKTKEGYYIEIPFFAHEATPQKQESPATFAHRLMQQQGIGIYPTGPESEFWSLKRWAIAMQEAWEKMPYTLAKRESSLEEDEKYYEEKLQLYQPNGNFVYLLSHYDHPTDNITTIGTFSSYAKAKEPIPIYQTYLGFRDVPNGFYIDPYQVDHAYWATGYASKIFQ